MRHEPIQAMMKKRRCPVYTIAGLALLMCAASAAAEPPAHYQQDCIACHAQMTGGEGETLYLRKDRLVNDYHALRARIEYCRRGVGTDWSKTQSDETAHYLNRRFYNFSQPR